MEGGCNVLFPSYVMASALPPAWILVSRILNNPYAIQIPDSLIKEAETNRQLREEW